MLDVLGTYCIIFVMMKSNLPERLLLNPAAMGQEASNVGGMAGRNETGKPQFLRFPRFPFCQKAARGYLK